MTTAEAHTLRRWGSVMRELRTEAGMTQRGLSIKAGISRACLRKMEKLDPPHISLTILEKALFAMGYELEVMRIDA